MKKPIIIADSKDLKNIIIQVDLKENKTRIMSAFSAWEDMALIMEALGVTIAKCINEGMSKKEVYKEVSSYFAKVVENYKMVMSEPLRGTKE